ncbi:MAG: glucuronosyltransferase [Dehalococcoidia bacterium]
MQRELSSPRRAKRAVLVSVHYWGSKRRAGFHWLADALWRAGWEVVFVTASVSWLSTLRRDFRMAYGVRREANRLLVVRERLRQYVWFTPWHPANLRDERLNRLSSPLFRRYGELRLGPLADVARGADLFIFESTPGLLLFDRFKRLAPDARFVYRVSDDLRLLRSHPVVLEAERRSAPRFDLVSVPSASMLHLFPGLDNVMVNPHGIRADLFDADAPSPYPAGGGRNVVFAGMPPFDTDFLTRAARLFPTWQFHIIGPVSGLPGLTNVHAHGERPFEETVPYLKHADIGLHTPTYDPGVESRADSLKVIQYTYCRLPIVAPEFLRSARSHVFPYRPGDDESVRAALTAAAGCDRAGIARDGISSWDDLAALLSRGEEAVYGAAIA